MPSESPSDGIFLRFSEGGSVEIGGLKPTLQSVQTALFAFFGRGQMKRRQTDAVIPAQAGI
ncbi:MULTISPECIES: hypothetical protein [Neisseria]|uniref:hypothetical protein n=1 Tax=Neisseria TaxID=482 RepID=UPI0002DC27D8|nr:MULTISPECIES: hypothetical protein [Neisseria]